MESGHSLDSLAWVKSSSSAVSLKAKMHIELQKRCNAHSNTAQPVADLGFLKGGFCSAEQRKSARRS